MVADLCFHPAVRSTPKVVASLVASVMLLSMGACGSEAEKADDAPAAGAKPSESPMEESDPLAMPTVSAEDLANMTPLDKDLATDLEESSEGYRVDKGAQIIVSGDEGRKGSHRVIAVACGQDVLNESPAIVAFAFDRDGESGGGTHAPLPIAEMPDYEELFPFMDYWQQRQADYSAIAEAMIAKTC